VQLSGQSSGHVQVFRDDAGNFVKVILHFSNTFTLSANGRSVTGKEQDTSTATIAHIARNEPT
jgi:hypothetical protein